MTFSGRTWNVTMRKLPRNVFCTSLGPFAKVFMQIEAMFYVSPYMCTYISIYVYLESILEKETMYKYVFYQICYKMTPCELLENVIMWTSKRNIFRRTFWYFFKVFLQIQTVEVLLVFWWIKIENGKIASDT